MWVIKIGGSWITNSKLNVLLSFLSKFSFENSFIIVAGGGCFSDAVRLVYKKKNMSEKTGHYIALKATEMFCHILKEINKDISLISDIDSLKKKNDKIKVWLPSMVLKSEPTFIKTWASTSDTVAAWLHKKINSDGLLFVKSLVLDEDVYNLKALQRNGVLDENVDQYLFGQKNIKIIGPDIINLLKKNSNWNKLFLKFKKVEF